MGQFCLCANDPRSCKEKTASNLWTGSRTIRRWSVVTSCKTGKVHKIGCRTEDLHRDLDTFCQETPKSSIFCLCSGPILEPISLRSALEIAAVVVEFIGTSFAALLSTSLAGGSTLSFSDVSGLSCIFSFALDLAADIKAWKFTLWLLDQSSRSKFFSITTFLVILPTWG